MLINIETKRVGVSFQRNGRTFERNVPTRIVNLQCDKCGKKFSRPYGRIGQKQREKTADHFCLDCPAFEKAFKKGHLIRGTMIPDQIIRNEIGRKKINGDGYYEIFLGKQYKDKYTIRRTGFISEHTYIMEKYLNRKLIEGEVIHHINCNKLDNSFDNLILVTPSEHAQIHSTLHSLLPKLLEQKILKFDREQKTYIFIA